MAVYFRRTNARLSQIFGVVAIVAGILVIGDGDWYATPFLLLGGAILLTRTAQNNGGVRGFLMDVLGAGIALWGAGVAIAY
ncbi:hypothetical protein [Halegenticoccus tardaugens]|uniref:hypothetical protein n=1 Tax=Halegenticoccus tardaugens TaxID=2071624 RepID=UPI00100A710D|nr:hypothetical protein [Halegenticoccus tardaugens]